MPELHHYAVGQLYNSRRTQWPETLQYNYRSGGHELVLFLAAPSPQEVQGIRQGVAEFALFVQKEALFLLFRFGTEGEGLPWSDAVFNWWLVPDAERAVPEREASDQERALLNIVLVNAEDGKIAVLRVVTLSPEFTAKLNAALRQQARTAWKGEAEYDKALNKIYQRYPTTEAMLNVADARCLGGD